MKSTITSVMRTNRSYLLSVLLMIFSLQSFATTYYSRTNGGNWNVSSTWSTVTYGSPTNTGTYPKIGDIAYIGDGYNININTTIICATIVIGGGRSGALKYLSGANYVLNVTGNLTVNRGAKLWYNTAVNQTHICQVGGNFTNNGTVDFYYAPSQLVNLYFNGNSNSNVGGTGTWDLNDVNMTKSVSTNYVSVNTSSFEAAIRNFVATSGTYIHNNTGSYTLNPASGNYTILSNVKFKVPAGTMSFSSTGDILTLQGELYVSGGTVNVGSTAGLKGLMTDQSGATIPYLEVSAGTLNVYGGISYASGSALDPMGFKMTGGTMNVNIGVTGTDTHVFSVNDVANSSFYMSNGTIVIQRPNRTGPLNFDIGICGTNGTVITTGGTLQIGNASTATGSYFSFVPLPNAAYPNIYVTGPAANVVSLATSVNSTADFKLLSLNIDPNKSFDVRSVAGTAGDGKQMTLLSNVPSTTNAINNNGTFYQRYSNVVFNGSIAQGVGGSTTTTFYFLTMNNAAGVTLNKPAILSAYLFLVNGNLITTNTNILTCGINANCDLGSSSSFVDGPLVHTVGTNVQVAKTYPFGKNGIHRPVILTIKHSTTTPATYRGEVFNSSASALPFTLPPTISRVSSVRYVKFIRQNIPNFSYAGIQMYYGTDDVVLDYTALQVGQDDGVSQWRSIGGAATGNGVGYINSGTFTQFTNYFALANPPGGMNPLPVTLTKFTAKRNGSVVDLGWTTTSEINCDHFIVERSTNNRDYFPVTTVNGAGNTTLTHIYKANDINPLKGLVYYRLKQIDMDGAAQAFPPVTVSTSASSDFYIYPTVSNGKGIHMSTSENDISSYDITVRNMNGKVVPASIRPDGYGVDLSVDDNANGMYIVTAVRGNDILKDKIIISGNN